MTRRQIWLTSFNLWVMFSSGQEYKNYMGFPCLGFNLILKKVKPAYSPQELNNPLVDLLN